MNYCLFSIFVYDFSVNLKSDFGKTKGDGNLIFIILESKTQSKYFLQKLLRLRLMTILKTDY